MVGSKPHWMRRDDGNRTAYRAGRRGGGGCMFDYGLDKLVMNDLIAALESASGPDRGLGDRVLLACGWRKTSVGSFYGPMYVWVSPNGDRYDEERRPDPTASMDAVQTLIDDGVEWSVTNLYGVAHAEVGLNFADRDFEIGRREDGNMILALATAALKARDAEQG